MKKDFLELYLDGLAEIGDLDAFLLEWHKSDSEKSIE